MQPARTGVDGYRLYAIGDVHGCLGLLDGLLRQIDADDSTPKSDQAFTFIGNAAFSGEGVGGELRYNVVDDISLISGDLNGDGAADFLIRLDGAIDLVAADFVL